MTPSRTTGWLVPAALAVAGAVGLVARSSVGDYAAAERAIDALVDGDLGRWLDVQPRMGILSIVLRVPFAAAANIAGLGQLGEYRAGLVPCLAALVVVGVWLGRRAAAAGGDGWLLVPVLAVLTPATVAMAQLGHPEEGLGAALCVAAVLLAGDGRGLAAGIALVLAIATKQWAVLAIAPALLAAPRGRRLGLTLTLAVAAAALTLPLALASERAFRAATTNASLSPSHTARASVWFLVAEPRRIEVEVEGAPASVTVFTIPGWAKRINRPLIVGLMVPLAALAWARGVRRYEALSLLALLFLLRCALDPDNNEYYHVPLLLSLLAWEVTTGRLRRGVPVATVAASACLWFTYSVLEANRVSPDLTNAFYLAWTAVLAAYLLHAMRLLPLPRRRSREPAIPA